MSDWREDILSDKVDLIHGHQFRNYDFTEFGIPVVKIGQVKPEGLDLTDCSFVAYGREEEFQNEIIKNGDVLMALTGATLGKACLVKNLNGIVFQNYRVGRFEPKNKDADLDKTFLYYLMIEGKLLTQVFNKVNTGAQGNIGKSDFEKIKIKYPNVNVQKKIGSILITVDNVIEKTQSAITKYKALKQGMLHDLFTRGINLNTGKLRPRYEYAPELYKESKLGWIPRDWKCDLLENLTEKVGSGITPTGGSEVYQTQGILFLRSQNILSGKLLLDDVAFISLEIDEMMANSRVKPFDVLLNITGASIGRCAFYLEELGNANVNQHVCIIRFKKQSKALAVFASEYLNTDFGQRQMYKSMAVGNREGLNYQQIKGFNFPDIRELKELEKIASIIESINNKLQTEQTYLQKMQQFKKGLMEDLLSGKKKCPDH